MKIKFLAMVFAAVSLITAGCSKEELQKAPEVAKEKKGIFPIFKFTVQLNRASMECIEGLGFCDAHLWILGDQLFSIDKGEMGFNSTVDEQAQTFELELLGDISTHYNTTTLEVGPDYLLPQAIADELNVSAAYITEGSYTYDSNIGSLGGYVVTYYTVQ